MGRRNLGRNSSDIPKKYLQLLIIEPVEKISCKVFSCGKVLNFREQLFGNLCIKCSGTEEIVNRKFN